MTRVYVLLATPVGSILCAALIVRLVVFAGYSIEFLPSVLATFLLAAGIICISRYKVWATALWKTPAAAVNIADSKPAGKRWLGFLRHASSDRNARKVAIFLGMNATFMLAEMGYGWWTNSLGLISDAFHMLFDCMALCLSLYASFMSTWQPSLTHSYGYARYEVLAGFSNGLLLVFVGCSILMESVARAYDPPHIEHMERLLLISVLGLLVNLVGVVFFHEFHAGHGVGAGCADGCCDIDATAANMRGVFLHILADTLGSVGVTVSSLLVKYKGWLMADPICSVFISALILLSVGPLLQQTMRILVQQAPTSHDSTLGNVLNLPSVLGYRDPHFWTLAGSETVGSLRVLIDKDGREQEVLTETQKVFERAGIKHITIQVEKLNYSSTHLEIYSEVLKPSPMQQDSGPSIQINTNSFRNSRSGRARGGKRPIAFDAVPVQESGGATTSRGEEAEAEQDSVMVDFLS